MYELSLFILDLAQNSLSADARLVRLWLVESARRNTMTVSVADNGKGMPADVLARAVDPFMTTKRERRKRIGLGLPFFKQMVEDCGGCFRIKSWPGRGTVVTGTYPLDNVDQPPVGAFGETALGLVAANPGVDFRITRRMDATAHVFDTRAVRAVLGAEAQALWQTPEVLAWMRSELADCGPPETNN